MSDMNSKEIKVLFGMEGLKESELNDIQNILEQQGVQCCSIQVKYKKVGILQYLRQNPDVDVLIVSEYLETVYPYSEKELGELQDEFEELLIVPILVDERKGTRYMVSLFDLGVYNALYQKDAGFDLIAKMIKGGRSRKECKAYYGLSDVIDSSIGANIEQCRVYIESGTNEDEFIKYARDIHGRVNEKEFFVIMSGLNEASKAALEKVEEFMPYLGIVIKEDVSQKTKGLKIPISFPSISFIPSKREEQVKVKTVVVKETVDLRSIVKDVLIGFSGQSRRMGNTHLMLNLAHYLQKNKYRVAVVELSENRGQSFKDIAFQKEISVENNTFLLEGVDYYCGYDSDKINALCNGDYNFILIDFGMFRPGIKELFSRCRYRFIVCAGGVWENESFKRYCTDRKQDQVDCYYLIQWSESNDVRDVLLEELGQDKVFFTSYDPDIFQGETCKSFRELFKQYVSENTSIPEDKVDEKKERGKFRFTPFVSRNVEIEKMEDEDNSVSTRRKKEGKKVEYRGTNVVFVTSLKHGMGNTHFSICLANYLAKQGLGDIRYLKCSDYEERRLNKLVGQYDLLSNESDVFSKDGFVVCDCGELGSLSEPLLLEMKRANFKIMMCGADDYYLGKLASFLTGMGDSAKELIYCFNLTSSKDKMTVKQMLKEYQCVFIPYMEVDNVYSKEVAAVFRKII